MKGEWHGLGLVFARAALLRNARLRRETRQQRCCGGARRAACARMLAGAQRSEPSRTFASSSKRATSSASKRRGTRGEIVRERARCVSVTCQRRTPDSFPPSHDARSTRTHLASRLLRVRRRCAPSRQPPSRRPSPPREPQRGGARSTRPSRRRSRSGTGSRRARWAARRSRPSRRRSARRTRHAVAAAARSPRP